MMGKVSVIVATVFLFGACTVVKEPAEVNGTPLVLTAYQEVVPDSKTAVLDGGTQVFWEPGDEIKVFSGSRAGIFMSNAGELTDVTEFTGILEGVGPDVDDIWAVYPSNYSSFDGECITTVIPSEQEAREGTFGQGMNVAIAHSNSTSLQFYNVCGGVRFSVGEEGISKVVFEGFNGEFLSGTVRIGFEGDYPKIKDVSEGSLFITLTPPGGGTFSPGKWYYIVAIPQALEKGFKIRFYKGDKYARLVSGKTATIKRRVFGSIADADANVLYESTSVSFPQTKEEIIASIGMMTDINHSVGLIIEDCYEASDAIIDEIKRVDGVVEAITDPSLKTIAVKQRDGVWVNFLLDAKEQSDSFFSKEQIMPSFNSNNSTTADIYKSSLSQSEDPQRFDDVYVNKKNNAIIIAPYLFDYNIDGIKNDLIEAGICEDNIDIRQEHTILLSDFYGGNLSKYDVIIIISHGGIGCSAYRHTEEKPFSTIIDTGIFYKDEMADILVDAGDITMDKVAFIGDGSNLTFAMTSDYLDDANFDNAAVFLMACHSAERIDDDGSLVKAFVNKGAGLVAGNNRTVNAGLAARFNRKMTYLLSKGLSCQNAYRQIKSSPFIGVFCDGWYNWALWKAGQEAVQRPIEYEDFDVMNYYVIKEGEKLKGKDYLLVNPFPKLGTPYQTEDGSVVLEWDCFLSPFVDNWYYPAPEGYATSDYVKPYPNEHYSVSYEIIVDSCLVTSLIYKDGDDCIKEVLWTPDNAGNHSWYIIARLIKNEKVIASYQSDMERFTVDYIMPEHPDAPQAVDMGLSIKWATCNLGAANPEDFGDFFAWGETDSSILYDKDNYIWYLNQKYGVNEKKILDFEDDAARQNLGGDWRMPSLEEYKELNDNCTFCKTTLHGVEVYEATSKINGAKIYLPTGCKYWTASGLSSVGATRMYLTDSEDSPIALTDFSPWFSYPIRPVCGDVLADNLIISRETMHIEKGSAVMLYAYTEPRYATNRELHWYSDNESVAKVDQYGTVTGMSEGKAKIFTATSDNRNITYCSVEVIPFVNASGVDLGLPSGLIWARKNLGATHPGEPGNDYIWGDPRPQTQVLGINSDYQYKDGSKYNGVDGRARLDPEDDAATVALGVPWRTPSVRDCIELLEACIWEDSDYNGLAVKIGTSIYNGEVIYLPSNGSGGSCIVWTSCWSSSRSQTACYSHLDFDGENLLVGSGNTDRWRFQRVRPVSKEGDYEAVQANCELTYTTTDGNTISIGNNDSKWRLVNSGYCSGVGKLVLNYDLTVLPSYLFYNQQNLASITIPGCVNEFQFRPFLDCPSLNSITVKAVIPPIMNKYSLDGLPESLIIYVPSESVEAYRAADFWNQFADRIQAAP